MAFFAELGEKRFRAIVRIFSAESDRTFMAESIDFSNSGMAFRTREDLQVGDAFDVSFSLPTRSECLKFPVQIMRVVERREEEESVYGARFTGIDGTTQSRLREFITGT